MMIMNELVGVYALWYRELKVFLREKSRIVSSIVNPLIWLIAFGGGIGASFFPGANYTVFIFPGIIMLMTLFTSIFFGLYIVLDKKLDFFKEVLVAPLSRITLFVGKMLGGCTDALIQAALIIVIGLFFNVQYTAYSVIAIIFFITMIAVGTTSFGLALGSQLNSFEGFGLVQSFVIFPLYFLSGALYPLNNLPEWLFVITRINPLTYIVDGMRGALLGLNTFPVYQDALIALGFAVVMVAVGTYAFIKMRY